jgi:2-oxoglutarate dehydrogenase complex dehydrogenase (E1) component-like enzyme
MGTLGSHYNLDLIEAEYHRWRRDPLAVEESWRLFFEGFELGLAQEPTSPAGDSHQTFIVQIINKF